MATKTKTFIQRIGSLFDRKPTGTDLVPTERGIGGAVARKDETPTFGSYFGSIIARSGIQRSYTDLTEEILRTLPDNKVRDLIRKASPIVAKALADYSDNTSSSFTWTADRTAPEDTDSPQRRLLSDFLMRLEIEGNSIEKIISELARGMFSHGGAFTELIIDEDGRTPVTLKTLDPTTAVFRKRNDELRGEIYELGQEEVFGSIGVNRIFRPDSLVSGINFRSLQDDPTIQYRPIQSEANNPYGTPILDPAVFQVIMMAGFFDSFQSALSGHVWPNMHITIDGEEFRKNSGVSQNPEKLAKKLEDAVADIQKNVAKLRPGNALVTLSDVSVAGQISGQNRAPLGSIKDIQDVLRRELIIAVQSQPVLMGSNEAIAETHAIEQIKAYGKLIRRGQRVLNALITEYFNLILMLNGYPPLAEFRLSYVNTADYKDQAMTFDLFRAGLLKASEDQIKLVESLEAAKLAGYINDQQAQELWEHEQEIRRQLNILPQEL